MEIERRVSECSSESNESKRGIDQNPPLSSVAQDLKGQERSDARFKFATKVMEMKIHLRGTSGMAKGVQEIQTDIVERRILKEESLESIAARYGKDTSWVETQVEQALTRFFDNSPELRREFPRKRLFMTKQERLDSMLRNQNLSKDQLKDLKSTFNKEVYDRNKGLFYRLEILLQEAGRPLPSSGDLSPIAEELEGGGGIVVFSFVRKQKGETKTKFLILTHDRDDALYDLKNPYINKKNNQVRPSGQTIYRSH